MNAFLTYQGDLAGLETAPLTELASLIEAESGLHVERQARQLPAGTKVLDVVVALTVLGLALSTISTFVSILAYWKSQQPKYSISVQRGSIKETIDNLNHKQLAELTSRLESAGPDLDLSIILSLN